MLVTHHARLPVSQETSWPHLPPPQKARHLAAATVRGHRLQPRWDRHGVTRLDRNQDHRPTPTRRHPLPRRTEEFPRAARAFPRRGSPGAPTLHRNAPKQRAVAARQSAMTPRHIVRSTAGTATRKKERGSYEVPLPVRILSGAGPFPLVSLSVKTAITKRQGNGHARKLCTPCRGGTRQARHATLGASSTRISWSEASSR